jgi:hypothetical protein
VLLLLLLLLLPVIHALSFLTFNFLCRHVVLLEQPLYLDFLGMRSVPLLTLLLLLPLLARMLVYSMWCCWSSHCILTSWACVQRCSSCSCCCCDTSGAAAAAVSMLVCRHVVLLEQPLYLDFLGMVGGWDNDAVWMKWRPHEGVKVHVVRLDGSKVRPQYRAIGQCSNLVRTVPRYMVTPSAHAVNESMKVHVVTLDGSKVRS